MKKNKTNSDPVIDAITAAAGLYFLGITIAGAIKRRREGMNGIGKVERIKRRIYKEVSLAQEAGVDFSQKYADLSKAELEALEHIGKDVVGWKQSKRAIESGKPYTESYYGSLRRAWNAVSGIQGIGATDYPVYDRDGNVCLTWTDVTEHIEHEPEAKTLLALPPHIEEKKKKKKTPKVSNEEYAEREMFAREFLEEYAKEYDYAERYLKQQAPNGDTVRELIVRDFVNKKLKVRDKNNTAVDVYIDGEWHSVGILYNIANALLEAWRTRGLRSDNLDDVRRQLLERAKFMGVSDDGSPFGAPIQGDDRYNYLDLINWIVVAYDYYDNGEKTVYPYRAFVQEWAANMFKDSLYRSNSNASRGNRRQYKVMPITELDFEEITGIF